MVSPSRTRSATGSPLGRAIKLLDRHYGRNTSVSPRDPFELLLWEYVAYLTDDADRASAYATLCQRVGITPQRIASAPVAVLESICRSGGAIGARTRADRMRLAALRVLDEFAGTLGPVLRLPYAESVRILKSFPSIGSPGADKILLLTGAQPVLALDSNALRVLLRLGYGKAHKSYAASYRSAQKAAMLQVTGPVSSLQEASRLLRRHGQELCRRNEPLCSACPLRPACHYAQLR